MRGFEDGERCPDITGASEAESTHHLGGKVGNNVAIEIGGDENVVVCRVLQQPHADCIDICVVRRDVGILPGHPLRLFKEHPVGRADDICLVDDRDLPTFVIPGEFECRPGDSFRTLHGVHFAGNGIMLVGKPRKRSERPREPRQHFRQFHGNGVELDAGIQIFRVLTEDDDVDPLLEVQRITGICLARPEADIEVEHLPHPDDGRAVHQSFPSQGGIKFRFRRLHRFRGDGPKHGRVDLAEQVDGARGKGIPFLAPEFPSNITVNVLGIELERVKNDACGLHHFDADAVTRQPCNLVSAHEEWSVLSSVVEKA